MPGDTLLLEIARCPVVRRCRDSTILAHPCSTIVAAQVPPAEAGQHVPEPWNGAIETAPILFVTWNPSWNECERFPTVDWSDEEIVGFFRTRFEHTNQNAQTWREITTIADRLLDREPIRGRDYAITDVVHCKSRNGRGAAQALPECRARYLTRLLALAGARLIVALGRDARRAIAGHYGVPEQLGVHGPVSGEGRERTVVLLGAPGSSDRRTLTDDELERARRALSGR